MLSHAWSRRGDLALLRTLPWPLPWWLPLLRAPKRSLAAEPLLKELLIAGLPLRGAPRHRTPVAGLAGLVALFGAQLCPTATSVGVYFLCNLATFLDNLAVTRMVWNRHCLCDLLGGCPRCLLETIFVPFCARFGV